MMTTPSSKAVPRRRVRQLPRRAMRSSRRGQPGSVSFAGTGYRVGNKFKGRQAGIRLVGDTVQITIDGQLVRTHRARHDKSKEFGALAQPHGKPRRSHDGVA